MYRIVIVSSKPAPFSVLAQALLTYSGIAIEWVASGEEALMLIKRAAPELMILDGNPGEPMDFALVRKIMQLNALINVVMVGQLPEKEFHDSAEGLGILMQLPPQPGLPETEALLARLALLGDSFESAGKYEETARQRGRRDYKGGTAS
jgi:chemotaxis response regulator CheB